VVLRLEEHKVVAAVLVDADRVLLCHRCPSRRWFPDVWDLPGGHVEPGENLEQALRRELGEELGIELESLDGEPVLLRVDHETGLDLTVWVTRCWQGTPSNQQPKEHDMIGWFESDELQDLEFADPGYRALLRQALLSS
jgi:8-oxo-dGTP diphosphatase